MNLSTAKASKATLLSAQSISSHSVLLLVAWLIVSLAVIPRTSAANPASGPQSSAVESQTYDGMITDTHCGAKHSAAIGLAAADCTRVCIHSGEEFALIDGDKVYVLSGDRDALKRIAGQRVKIVGTLNGNTISVSSVVPGK
jgi:hypothetical protein